MAEYIGQAAIDHGWESYIAYARNIQPTTSRFIKIGNKFDVYEHMLETRLFDNHGFASRHATRKMISKIVEIKPDIIHLHNLHGYYLNLELLFKFLGCSNIPVVWTLHDCWAFTGHCAHFVYARCNKWKTHCGPCPLFKEYPRSFLFDRSFHNFERKKHFFNLPSKMVLVPVSKWISDFVQDSFLSKYSTNLIYNGVDINIFKPSSKETVLKLREELGLEGKFVVIGVANTWNRDKGWCDFIKMSEKIDNDVMLIMVGLSKEQKKHLPSNIVGIERTNTIQHLVDLYSMADVFWNPTYADTFPTTTLEAQSCGTPCIVYKTGGAPEAISEGTGCVIEQGNVNDTLNMLMLYKNNGKQMYTDTCRRNIVENFNKDKQYRLYIDLYEHLINKSE